MDTTTTIIATEALLCASEVIAFPSYFVNLATALEVSEELATNISGSNAHAQLRRILDAWIDREQGSATFENLVHALEANGLHAAVEHLRRNIRNPQATQDDASSIGQTSVGSERPLVQFNEDHDPRIGFSCGGFRDREKSWRCFDSAESGMIFSRIAAIMSLLSVLLLFLLIYHLTNRTYPVQYERFQTREDSTRCGGRVMVVKNGETEKPIAGCHNEVYEEMHFIGGNLSSEDLSHTLTNFFNLKFISFQNFTIIDDGSDKTPKIQRALLCLHFSFIALSNILAFFERYNFSYPQLRNVTLVATNVTNENAKRIQKLFLTSFANKSEKRLVCKNSPGCQTLMKTLSVSLGRFVANGIGGR